MPAGIPFDGHTRVLYLAEADAPADLEAITATELGDALDLSGYLPPDGAATNESEETVSGADLISSFNSEAVGRFAAKPVLTFKRQLVDGSEEAYTTFATRGARGTLLFFYTLAEGADPGVGDDYKAFSVQNGRRNMLNTAANTESKFTVNFPSNSEPVDGTVVAS